MARNHALDEIADPTKLLDIANAHPSLAPAEQILDDDALMRFQDLFSAVVHSAKEAAGNPETEHSLSGAVDSLKAFLIGYNGRGSYYGTDLAYQFVRATNVDLEELSGMKSNLLLNAFYETASAEGIDFAVVDIMHVDDIRSIRKRHKIVPGNYSGPLTHGMIIESARAEQDAHPLRRRPTSSDGLLLLMARWLIQA